MNDRNIKFLSKSFWRKMRRESCSLFLIPYSFRAQRGSNLLETLLAIGLVAAMAPFAYNRVSEISREVTDVAEARHIWNWKASMSGFIRSNQMDWDENTFVELDEKELQEIGSGKPGLMPLAAFIEKFRHAGGVTVEAYLLFPAAAEGLRMHRIARHLGGDAAVANSENTAFSAEGGWSIETEILQENDIVYRVSVDLPRDDSFNFLHRVDTGDDRMNTMERNLLMGHNNLLNAGTVNAGLLDSKMVASWFVASEAFSADEAVFPDGANLDGSNITFSGMRVMGDVIGFRNIVADAFGGGGITNWSTQGHIVAERASVVESVNVARNMVVRSPSARTVSDFLGVSAHSLAVPFVSADELRFAGGFGLTISNELSSSFSDVPLRLGGWMFPQTIAPSFSSLALDNASNIAGKGPQGFEKVTERGWRDRAAGVQIEEDEEEELEEDE